MTPFDRYLTTEPQWRGDDEREDPPEVEYICSKCGGTPDQHPEVPTPDGNNVMQVCPLKCTGCDQFIVITDGKSECGGEGEGICCVFADDEDPCPAHPDGHNPDQVFEARASHQAAFRQQEPYAEENINGEQDWTDPTHVLGAVLAQLEDLSEDDRIRVLNQALQAQGVRVDSLPDPGFLTEAGNCPLCGSDLIQFADEHYCECCDCGWSGSPTNTEGE